jgi:hypothetical protein
MVEGEAVHQLHTQLLFLENSSFSSYGGGHGESRQWPQAVSLWTMTEPQQLENPSHHKE